MSYVLDKVLNTDIVDEINKLVVNDTIKSLKEENQDLLYSVNVGLEQNEILTDDNQHLKSELQQYNKDIDYDIIKDFDEETIDEWTNQGGDDGLGGKLFYDTDIYDNFDDWYVEAKDNFINWWVADNQGEYFHTLPPIWIYQTMKYHKETYGQENFGNLNDYHRFIRVVLYWKIFIHLEEEDENVGTYSNSFKNCMANEYQSMKEIYDNDVNGDTTSDVASLDTDPNGDGFADTE